MDDFFVFLDIDGVMYDWEWLMTQPRKGGRIKRFNPESVAALNKLTNSLSREFNTSLVITSTWRHWMQDTIELLSSNGVDFKDIRLRSTTTDGNPDKRGEQILKFLRGDKGQNFVIIDDEMFDYLDHFDMSQIIKTNMRNNSLNMKMVDNYLKSIGMIYDVDDLNM